METTDPGVRQIVCSGCLLVFPEPLIHVVPYFNRDVCNCVAAYRCEQCWLPSLAEVQTWLADEADETGIASMALFFQRRGVFLHEFRRGDPLPVIRKKLDQMLQLLRSGAIRLAIGRLPA